MADGIGGMVDEAVSPGYVKTLPDGRKIWVGPVSGANIRGAEGGPYAGMTIEEANRKAGISTDVSAYGPGAVLYGPQGFYGYNVETPMDGRLYSADGTRAPVAPSAPYTPPYPGIGNAPIYQSGTKNNTPGMKTANAVQAPETDGPSREMPSPAGGNQYSGIAGGINSAVPPSGQAPAPNSPEFLATKAKEILGQYAKYKPDGTLDYSAMSGANGQAFWDSLPTNVKNAMQEFGLGKKMQAAATQGGPTPPGFPSGGGTPGGGGGFTPGQGPAAGAGGSINLGQGGTNPAPQPGTTPLPGQGTTTGPGMVTRQLPFDLQALLGKIKVNAAAAGGPNQPSGNSGGGNPAGGGSNYPGLDNAPRGFPTPSGRELRSFDPSYLIQQMRAKFGAKGGAGQSNSIPLAQGQGAPQNNLIAWDNIFRKPL